jgi:hypothetical protein
LHIELSASIRIPQEYQDKADLEKIDFKQKMEKYNASHIAGVVVETLPEEAEPISANVHEEAINLETPVDDDERKKNKKKKKSKKRKHGEHHHQGEDNA